MLRQTCGTRYEKVTAGVKDSGFYSCQRDAGHELHGERVQDESLILLRLLVIAWDSDRTSEFIPAVQEARAFLGLKLTDEKAEKEKADFGDLTRLDTASQKEQMAHLASAMKQVIPPELIKQLLEHLDPLTSFVEFLQTYEQQ